jgi:hypothetical protein
MMLIMVNTIMKNKDAYIICSKRIALEVYVEKTMYCDQVLSTDCSKLKQFGSFTTLKLIRHGPQQRSQYSKLLWAGLPSDQIPVQVRFSALSRPAVGPTQAPVQMELGVFPSR